MTSEFVSGNKIAPEIMFSVSGKQRETDGKQVHRNWFSLVNGLNVFPDTRPFQKIIGVSVSCFPFPPLYRRETGHAAARNHQPTHTPPRMAERNGART